MKHPAKESLTDDPKNIDRFIRLHDGGLQFSDGAIRANC